MSASAYRSGDKIRDERIQKIYDFPNKQRIYGSEILSPEDTPEWVGDRSQLWNEVERTERRTDARLAKEVRVAIPVELDERSRVGVVRAFARKAFVKAGQIADIAYHNFAGKGGHNPHAHIMLTTREIDGKGFGKKNRFWDTRKWIKQIRKAWEQTANWFLERAGFKQKIDHRSLEDQGIDRIPQIHLGREVIEMERKGIRTEKGDRYRAIEKANDARKNLVNTEAERLNNFTTAQSADWVSKVEELEVEQSQTKTPSDLRELNHKKESVKSREDYAEEYLSPSLPILEEVMDEEEEENEREEEKDLGPEI